MAIFEDRLEGLLEELTPDLEKKFRDAIQDIQSGIILKEVVERLEEDDVQGAMDLLNIEEDSFNMLYEALRNVTILVGALVATQIPRLKKPDGSTSVFRFNPRDPELVNWIEINNSTLISGFLATINENVRNVIVTGKLERKPTKEIVYNIIGLMNTKTNSRDGSVFGLSAPQVETVSWVRRAFENSDFKEMGRYLTLVRRNKSYDSLVIKAIENKEPLGPNTINIITTLLADSYQKLRIETLVSTQVHTIAGKTKDLVHRQAIKRADLGEDSIEREWLSMRDVDVRHTHRELHGQVMPGFEEPFVSTSGALMRFACDVAFGAPLGEIAGCRCRTRYRYKEV